MEEKYDDLSEIQKDKYLSICGYKYKAGSLKGEFDTMLAYCETIWKSPWYFKFQFDREKGYLFCFIGHRLTNDSVYGWDYEGNKLSAEITHKVYEPHGLANDLRILKS